MAGTEKAKLGRRAGLPYGKKTSLKRCGFDMLLNSCDCLEGMGWRGLKLEILPSGPQHLNSPLCFSWKRQGLVGGGGQSQLDFEGVQRTLWSFFQSE